MSEKLKIINIEIYITFVFILLSTNIYIINNGGGGLNLPLNILCWIAIACIVGCLALKIPIDRLRVISVSTWFFLTGVAVLIIPIFFTEAIWLERASWRIASLIAGGVFYMVIGQVTNSRALLLSVLYGIVIIVTLQAILALIQLFTPEYSWVPRTGLRIYGIFQQPNVLASFIACGLSVVMMLFILPEFEFTRKKRENLRVWTLGSLIFVLSMLLVWLQSRVGWLGGTLAAVLFLLRFWIVFKPRCKLAFSIITFGISFGLAGMLWGDMLGNSGELSYLSHQGSNVSRWTMLRDTLYMIAKKPILGWGYGGFEYSIQHFRISQSPPTSVTEIANHPHNEILFWWVEGGVVSLLGIVLIIIGGMRVIHLAWRRDTQEFILGSRDAGIPTALCFVLLPILLHTQLEFPFYLSTLHFMVFLMVLAMLDRQVCGTKEYRPLPILLGKSLRVGMIMISFSTVVILFFALRGGIVLTHAERKIFTDMNDFKEMSGISAWAHKERLDFDEQVYALLLYNQTSDVELLDHYAAWAVTYLHKRIDANVYMNLIRILQYKDQSSLAEKYMREGILLFPNDPRFNQIIASP